MRNLLILILFFVFGFSYSQQLNCTVTINTSKLANTNDQIFKTLEKSLSDYINKTDWTNLTSKNNERIDCSMYITVNEYNSGQFKATLQVQSSRPVYNSSYATPILNYNDNDFSFNYVEFENLTFNPNSFNSNLIAVISYYCYMIIGMDADTFAL